MKPFAEACEENKQPILEVLQVEFAGCSHILEIGSGTGQHAVFFGASLPQLTWQTSDMGEAHGGINAWLEEDGPRNVLAPLHLDVSRDSWPQAQYDGVFSANTVHIMAWPQVVKMFQGIGKTLAPGGIFCLYGPFNYGGAYTSESNARFDQWLKARDPDSGIRDFDDLDRLARENGMVFRSDYEMPVNNRTLVWIKRE